MTGEDRTTVPCPIPCLIPSLMEVTTVNLNCPKCSHVYELDAERDVINVYPMEPQHGHIVTKCPACGTVLRLFIDPEQVQALSDLLGIELKVHATRAPKAIAAMARKIRKERDEPAVPAEPRVPTDELPWPPRESLIELYDTMRHVGGECGGCLWHKHWPQWP